MARASNKLSALDVEKKTKPGYYGDGGGLWLRITKAGTKSWTFRYMLGGRARYMGLGPFPLRSLAWARNRARAAEVMLEDGLDPIEQRKATQAPIRSAEPTNGPTFRTCAEKYIAAHESTWKNPIHRGQWRSTLATYCYPVFGDKPLADLNTTQVLAVLEPIWTTKHPTADKLRGRIESVWDYGKALGHCRGENPARKRGHLQNLLPQTKVHKVKHHAALPRADMPKLMAELNVHAGLSARALQLTILCATRTSETTGARWAEFDLKAKVWAIPGDRTKSGRPHRVPLSAQAIAVLAGLDPFAGFDRFGESTGKPDDYVFPGAKGGALSNMAMAELLKELRPGITVHGFRSTFRDWAAEVSDFPREVAEAALAHVLSDKTEAAYQRGDLFEKRRVLMEAWADFCRPKPAEQKAAA